MFKQILAILAVLSFLVCPDVWAAVEVGQPAPSLTVTELNGTPFNLQKTKGKVVILHIWASWCPSCREEMPVLDSFYKKFRDQGVEVIALSADRRHSQDKVTEIMKGFTFPCALLSDASENGFGTLNEIPVTYIIDPKNVVRARLTPDQAPISETGLMAVISPLLLR